MGHINRYKSYLPLTPITDKIMEIKASDLRMGNWVKTYSSTTPIKVLAIGHNKDGFEDYFIDYNGGRVALKVSNDFFVVEGIPLTPEILLKAGLVERYAKGEWSWSDCKLEGNWQSYTELYEVEGGLKYLSDYPIIKYVHQLQNLYHALTGQELTVRI